MKTKDLSGNILIKDALQTTSLYKEITTPLKEFLIEEEEVEPITKVVVEQRCQRLSRKDNIYTSS